MSLYRTALPVFCLVQAGSWILQGMSVLSARPQLFCAGLCILARVDRWVWVSDCVHPHSLFLQEKAPLGAENTNSFTNRVAVCSCFSQVKHADFDKGGDFLLTTMALRRDCCCLNPAGGCRGARSSCFYGNSCRRWGLGKSKIKTKTSR